MRIFAEVPWAGPSNDSGVVDSGILSVFAGYFSDTLELRTALLYGDTQSVVGFSVIPKYMTLNDTSLAISR